MPARQRRSRWSVGDGSCPPRLLHNFAQDVCLELPPSCRGPNPLFSLWNVAAAVTNTVKARADELVKSVVDTDWRNELSTFSREVGEEGKTLSHKTAEIVEHLPEQVGHLPEKVGWDTVVRSPRGSQYVRPLMYLLPRRWPPGSIRNLNAILMLGT